MIWGLTTAVCQHPAVSLVGTVPGQPTGGTVPVSTHPLPGLALYRKRGVRPMSPLPLVPCHPYVLTSCL